MAQSTTRPTLRLEAREFVLVDPSVADLGALLRGMRPRISRECAFRRRAGPPGNGEGVGSAPGDRCSPRHCSWTAWRGELRRWRALAGESRRSSRRSRADRPGFGGRWRDPAVGVRGSRRQHGRGVHRRPGAECRRAGCGSAGRVGAAAHGGSWTLDVRASGPLLPPLTAGESPPMPACWQSSFPRLLSIFSSVAVGTTLSSAPQA